MDNIEDLSKAEVVDYVVQSLEEISQLKEANQKLSEQLAVQSAEKVELEKVASAAPAPFEVDLTSMDQAFNTLQKVAFIDKQASIELKDLLSSDLNLVFPFIERLAFEKAAAQSLGDSVNLTSSDEISEDPYGWKEALSPQHN